MYSVLCTTTQKEGIMYQKLQNKLDNLKGNVAYAEISENPDMIMYAIYYIDKEIVHICIEYDYAKSAKKTVIKMAPNYFVAFVNNLTFFVRRNRKLGKLYKLATLKSDAEEYDK